MPFHRDMSLLGTAVTGTEVSGVGVEEISADGVNFHTILTIALTGVVTGDNANLALGTLIYTLPAGPCVINSAAMSIAMTHDETTAQVPDTGLGTVIGTGAVVVLGGTATFEDIISGVAMGDMAGTAKEFIGSTSKTILTAAAHTIHLNYAVAWADVTTATCSIAGTVGLNWTNLQQVY